MFVVPNGENDKPLLVKGISSKKIVIIDDNPVIKGVEKYLSRSFFQFP